jgi:Domain of unknown function (DUF4158)
VAVRDLREWRWRPIACALVGGLFEEGLPWRRSSGRVYPRFKRAVSDRELLESFTPGLAEIEWARELTRSPEHCLALVVWLKSFQRLGYFPDLFEVPLAVVEHVRGLWVPNWSSMAGTCGVAGR